MHQNKPYMQAWPWKDTEEDEPFFKEDVETLKDFNTKSSAREKLEFRKKAEEKLKNNIIALNNVLKDFRNTPFDIKEIKGDEREKRALVKEIKKDFALNIEILELNKSALILEYFQEKMLGNAKITEIEKQAKIAQDLLTRLLKMRKKIQSSLWLKFTDWLRNWTK